MKSSQIRRYYNKTIGVYQLKNQLKTLNYILEN